MMEEYNTHTYTYTYTHVHMDILILTVSFASMSARASSSNLTVLAWPLEAANMSAVILLWWKYCNYGKYDKTLSSKAHAVILHSNAQISYYQK